MENQIQTVSSVVEDHIHLHEDTFAPVAKSVNAWAASVAHHNKTLFRTDADYEAMWEAYLSGFTTTAARQYHNCSCCKSFFKRFAGLVFIKPDYTTDSAVWPENMSDINSEFRVGLTKVREIVLKARITSPFYSYGTQHGIAVTRWHDVRNNTKGEWEHFSFYADVGKGPNRVFTPGQNMAAAREDYRLMRKGFSQYPLALFEQALNLFMLDEKLKYYPAQISHLTKAVELITLQRQTDNRSKIENMYWVYATNNGKGFTHLIQNTTGEFMKTLGEGNQAKAKADFLKMTDPKDYMMPKAAPTAANVARAENIVEKLGVKNSLRRRSLRRDELNTTLWLPKTAQNTSASASVFGHLKTKDEPKVNLAAESIIGGRITLTKFIKDILPLAEKLVMTVPSTRSRQYLSYTTAVDQEAPPIFRGDGRICGYNYADPTHAQHWGLRAGSQVEVIAILDDIVEKRDDGTTNFVLAEGRDIYNPPAAIFPEMLLPEFHEVRVTIASFSANAKLEETEKGFVAWNPRGPVETEVRVTMNSGKTTVSYTLVNLQ